MSTTRSPLELRLLAPVLALSLSVLAFFKITGEMLEGDAHAWDLLILQLCRVPGHPDLPMGPTWLHEGMRDLTALGSPVVLVLTVGAVWGFLMLARQRAMAWLTAGSGMSGLLVAMALKGLFSRARPDAAFHNMLATGYSFPSGHAMMSAVVYLTLAALVARITPHWRLRAYALGAAALLAGLVGLSRIYLGVHWASDVAAGWAAGSAWALLCWLLADRLGLGTTRRG